MMLRPGNAGANTAADHIRVTEQVLTQVRTPAQSVLIRTDSAGGTHEFLNYLTGRGLGYSGVSDSHTAAQAIGRLLPQVGPRPMTPTGPNATGRVAELTGMLDLSSWPTGMRVIVRKERPHPGAQLRFTDSDGLRLTAFATNTTTGQLAALELRHRRRARCEDRIRSAKDCGLRNPPAVAPIRSEPYLVRHRRVGLRVTCLDPNARPPAHSPARRWEPKALRLRLFSVAARITCHARRRCLKLAAGAPHLQLLLDGIHP